MVFHSFTQFVDLDQPVFGLQSIGLTSNEYPAETIEEITTVYLKEILEHNPDGPYNFAGYSFGGLVAYELTQQLMQMGKKVNMLGILDTNISNELYYDVYASRISTKLKRQIPKLAFISKSFMVNPKATFEYQKYAVTERVKSSIQKILPPKPVIQKLTNEEIILEKITKAYHNYAIKPIQARVDLFRCKKRLYFIDDPVYLGWKKFCESVHVHEIEGDHASFLFSPNDIFFAKTIQRVLNERNQ
jgi:thioesterase domain-containing protein